LPIGDTMTRHYRTYTDQDIIKYAAEVKSMSALLKKLGLKPAGGSYAYMKTQLHKLNLKCEHWTGQAWNKDQRLKNWENYRENSSIKKHLIKERRDACEICGITEWLGNAISIELHHIDGDNTNNNKENLQLLCPNCHSQTDNFRGKNQQKNPKDSNVIDNKCCECGNKCSKKAKRCVDCVRKPKEPNSCMDCGKTCSHYRLRCKSCAAYEIQKHKTKRPNKEQLIKDKEELKYFTKIASKYNVSDKAVKKWFVHYDLA